MPLKIRLKNAAKPMLVSHISKLHSHLFRLRRAAQFPAGEAQKKEASAGSGGTACQALAGGGNQSLLTDTRVEPGGEASHSTAYYSTITRKVYLFFLFNQHEESHRYYGTILARITFLYGQPLRRTR